MKTFSPQLRLKEYKDMMRGPVQQRDFNQIKEDQTNPLALVPYNHLKLFVVDDE